MVRNMVFAMGAVFAILPLAVPAHAAPFCNLADQLTLEKMDADCRNEFVSTLKNEQDRIDMARVINTWEPPEGLEITSFDSYLEVSVPNQPVLRVGFLSFHPLMLMINDKVYLDKSKDPSWSRRVGKIFADAAKTNSARSQFQLPAWLMMENAEALVFGPPTDVATRVGYTYVVNQGDKSQPIVGTSRELVVDGKVSNSAKYTPDYAGGFFEKAAYNLTHNFHGGKVLPLTNNEYECAYGALKKGNYRVTLNGEQKAVTARLTGENEVMIKGVLPEGRELKVRVIPQGDKGVRCVDSYASGRRNGCRSAWAQLAKTDKDIRKAYVSAMRKKTKISCRSLGAKEQDCRTFFAEKFPQTGTGNVVKDDGEGKNSIFSACKDAECSKSEPLTDRGFLQTADPGAQEIARQEAAQGATDTPENEKELYIGMLEANYVKNPAKYCKTRRGKTKCDLPTRDKKAIDKYDENAWKQIVDQRDAINSGRISTDGTKLISPKDEKAKLTAKTVELRGRLQEIAIGMMMYSTPCSDPEAAQVAKNMLTGDNYKGGKPADAVR